MKKEVRRSGVAFRLGTNVRVIESGKDGTFGAYMVPGKSLPDRLLEIGQGVFFMATPADRSSIRVGSTVRAVKKPFGRG